MAAKRRRNSRRSSRARRRPVRRPLRRTLRRWLLLILLAAGLAGFLYGLYLDQLVRIRFEGKRWALPARVYARPLELFVGSPLNPQALAEELNRLGYGHVRHPDRPGTYSRNGERFLLRSRPFRFWDGAEPSRYLAVRFRGGRVERLKDAAAGADLPLVRLDAALIDSIYPHHREDRVLVRRADLPKLLVTSLLAVEDREFYRHHGLSPLSIARALWSNLRAGRVVQGGSTLTQQLVKNFFLTSERSLLRKLNEAAMALLLDWRYDKDQILEAYANEIYLGQDGPRAIHGFGLASRFYFNRALGELDLPRIALLVGMIKGPSLYDPRRNPERARERRNLVLDVLEQQGVVTGAQADAARRAGLGVSASGGRPVGRYPAFMELVRRQLQRDYRDTDLRSEGLSVFTTLDPLVQSQAEGAIARRLPELERSRRSQQLEAAAVVASSENGEVLALVGGRRSGYSGFNRALEAVRPIGSLVKPWVYLEALMQPGRYTLASPLDDGPVRLKQADGTLWAPQNFDRKSHGRVPLYQALAHSYNLATVHLGLDLGVPRVVQRLQEFGLEREVAPLPSLLLGALALSPLEVTQLYQGLASSGFPVPLRAVREVLDQDGKALSRYPLEMKQAARPAPVYLLNWALRQVVAEGTGRSLSGLLPAGLSVAGKTGTTDDYRDSWFAGFSGDKVATVWVGRDDNRPAGLSGAAGALRVWGDIIGRTNSLPFDPLPPPGVETRGVDLASGLQAGRGCGAAVQLPFIAGSAPTRRAPCERPAEASGSGLPGFLERLFR
jgi:penicillin-binding protein 1B